MFDDVDVFKAPLSPCPYIGINPSVKQGNSNQPTGVMYHLLLSSRWVFNDQFWLMSWDKE